MDKKQLLKAVCEAEIRRLHSLSRRKLVVEFCEWFDDEPKKGERSMSLIHDMISDFMGYRESESTRELKSLLANY